MGVQADKGRPAKQVEGSPVLMHPVSAAELRAAVLSLMVLNWWLGNQSVGLPVTPYGSAFCFAFTLGQKEIECGG